MTHAHRYQDRSLNAYEIQTDADGSWTIRWRATPQGPAYFLLGRWPSETTAKRAAREHLYGFRRIDDREQLRRARVSDASFYAAEPDYWDDALLNPYARAWNGDHPGWSVPAPSVRLR